MNTLTQGVGTVRDWMKANPVKSVLFSSLFSTLSTCAAFREDWIAAILVLGGIGLVTLFILIHIFEHARKVGVAAVTAFLCLYLADPVGGQEILVSPFATAPLPLDAQVETAEAGGSGGGGSATTNINDPQCGAGPAIAVVVICAVGYCIYKLVKFCQKKFPKNPPPPPPDEEDDLTNGAAAETDTEAAAFNYGELGSCLPCDEAAAAAEAAASLAEGGSGGGHSGFPSEHVTFQIDLHVDVDEEDEVFLIPTLSFVKGETNMLTFKQFSEEIQKEYGVKVTGTDGPDYYARNGVPITKEESTIHFDEVTKLVKIGAGDYSVVVERSFDFSEWTEILHTEVSNGANVRVIDTTPTGQAFYRFHGYRSD